MRMRQQAYRSMLRQDQTWFDRNENDVSSLTTLLSRDSELVHGALGGRLGTVLQTITTLAVNVLKIKQDRGPLFCTSSNSFLLSTF